MKKYLLIAFVLMLLFFIGCKKPEEVPKTGGAYVPPLPRGGLSVIVNRDIICGGTSTVNLNIATSGLYDNEIIVIVDRIPWGTTYVDGSASIAPAYVVDDKLVWLFAKNPPQTTLEGQGRQVTQGIPSRITYRVSGSGTSDFRGKWSLEAVNKDGLIGGRSSC